MKFRFTFLLTAMPLFLLTQETWSQAQPQWRTLPNAPRTASRFDDVFFINPQVGWVIGSRGEIFKTNDGGVSWKQPSTITSSGLRCVGFANAAKGWVGTLRAANFLFMTTDSGKTWNRVDNIPEPKPQGICGISVVNENIVYASGLYGGAPRVIKTTDGGVAWKEKILSNTRRDVQGIGFYNEKLGWEGGWSSPTYETTDGGETWQQAGFGFNVNRFRFLNDTLGYAVGQTVYKFSITAPTVGVKENPIPPPAGITLFQNYPNPFWSGATPPAPSGGNPSTKIRYVLDRDDEIAILTVYDLAGRKIKTLFAGGRSPGEYIADWDGTNEANSPVAAGVYISRLQAGGVVQSRKMLLLR